METNQKCLRLSITARLDVLILMHIIPLSYRKENELFQQFFFYLLDRVIDNFNMLTMISF